MLLALCELGVGAAWPNGVIEQNTTSGCRVGPGPVIAIVDDRVGGGDDLRAALDVGESTSSSTERLLVFR